MVKTGIPKLDDFLGGGIPRGKSLVYYSQPGVEGEIFGLQSVYGSLKNGGICVFVVSSTIPDIIKSQFKEFGCDMSPFKDKLVVFKLRLEFALHPLKSVSKAGFSMRRYEF